MLLVEYDGIGAGVRRLAMRGERISASQDIYYTIEDTYFTIATDRY